MKENTRSALRVALGKILRDLAASPPRKVAIPRLRFKQHDHGWHAVSEELTYYREEFLPGHIDLVADLTDALQSDYPEYCQMVCFAGLGRPLRAEELLTRVAGIADSRWGTLAISEHQLDELIGDVARFFDKPVIEAKVLGPVEGLSVQIGAQPIAFPSGATLRRITDDEASHLFGATWGPNSRTLGNIPEAIFERAAAIPLLVGDAAKRQATPDILGDAHRDFERALVALQAFRDLGPIGVEVVSLMPLQPWLFDFGGGRFLPGVPTGMASEVIKAEEVGALTSHVAHFVAVHPDLEFGFERLFDACRRTKARDSLLDAVIGLESMLLHETGAEKYRGEMRYRFAMNYSSLPFIAKRREAFRLARDLYDLRSKIVHGSEMNVEAKLGSAKVTVFEAAKQARSVLRGMLNYFQKAGEPPGYSRSGYWEDLHFGCSNEPLP